MSLTAQNSRPPAPAPDVEPLHLFDFRAGSRRLRDEQIDHVLAPPIDDRGHRLAVDVVEPPADQREALRGQVDHRRRDSSWPLNHGLTVCWSLAARR